MKTIIRFIDNIFNNAFMSLSTNYISQYPFCTCNAGNFNVWNVYFSITHYLIIIYVTEPTVYSSRMAGYFLFVSNTTSTYNGKLCFHEIQTVNGTPLEDQLINCSVHGRYVTYYNERKADVTYPKYYSKFAFYELCELEVYGKFFKR